MNYPIMQLNFLDHSEGPADEANEVECTVWGVLIEETKLSYHILTWLAEDNPNSHNSDISVILKCAVTSKKKIGSIDI